MALPVGRPSARSCGTGRSCPRPWHFRAPGMHAVTRLPPPPPPFVLPSTPPSPPTGLLHLFFFILFFCLALPPPSLPPCVCFCVTLCARWLPACGVAHVVASSSGVLKSSLSVEDVMLLLFLSLLMCSLLCPGMGPTASLQPA